MISLAHTTCQGNQALLYWERKLMRRKNEFVEIEYYTRPYCAMDS